AQGGRVVKARRLDRPGGAGKKFAGVRPLLYTFCAGVSDRRVPAGGEGCSMFHKGKLIVFVGSALIVLYGVSAAFYGKVVAKDEAYKELSVFIDALKKINDDYVEPPDLDKVQEGALRGLIESLDPYSSFLTKDQIDGIEKRKAAGKAGIGVVLSKRTE